MEEVNKILEMLGLEKKQICDTRYMLYKYIPKTRYYNTATTYKVGDIRYKKIHDENQSNKVPAKYGYHININSDLIKCNGIISGDELNIHNNLCIYLNDKKSEYLIITKQNNNFKINILRENNKDYMSLNITPDFINICFPTKTKKNLIEENIRFEYKNDGTKKYSYSMEYCKKNKEPLLSTNKKESFYISGETSLTSKETLTIINSVSNKKTISKCNASIEDMYIKHQQDSDSFNRFINLFDKIVPFNKGVLEIIRDNDKSNILEQFGVINKNNNNKLKINIKK